MEKFSTGDEVDRNTLVTVNQVIVKSWQDRQIWDVNGGVMLQHKSMQLKRLQATKQSTPGLNNDIGITNTSAGNSVKNKKEERKILAEDISQLLTRQYTLIGNPKDYPRYRH